MPLYKVRGRHPSKPGKVMVFSVHANSEKAARAKIRKGVGLVKGK